VVTPRWRAKRGIRPALPPRWVGTPSSFNLSAIGLAIVLGGQRLSGEIELVVGGGALQALDHELLRLDLGVARIFAPEFLVAQVGSQLVEERQLIAPREIEGIADDNIETARDRWSGGHLKRFRLMAS
jgi:hypothetical protein